MPRRPDGQPSQFVVLAMGKLGGAELNYSSDIDLIFLYEADGRTDGEHPIGNVEFFERLARELVRLLTEQTALGYPYRVDLRLRPEGERGPVVHSLDGPCATTTWPGELGSARPMSKPGPWPAISTLGRQFLEYLEPWVYRRYLGLADITGIKALKRRIEQRTVRDGTTAAT